MYPLQIKAKTEIAVDLPKSDTCVKCSRQVLRYLVGSDRDTCLLFWVFFLQVPAIPRAWPTFLKRSFSLVRVIGWWNYDLLIMLIMLISSQFCMWSVRPTGGKPQSFEYWIVVFGELRATFWIAWNELLVGCWKRPHVQRHSLRK